MIEVKEEPLRVKWKKHTIAKGGRRNDEEHLKHTYSGQSTVCGASVRLVLYSWTVFSHRVKVIKWNKSKGEVKTMIPKVILE